MTQRDRLIELLDTNCGYVDEVRADELADRLIENNVMVLPCKVGDTIYRIDIDPLVTENEIECFNINNIVVCDDGDILLKYDNYDGI